MGNFLIYLRSLVKRLQRLFYRVVNFLSFGLIPLPASAYLSDYYPISHPHPQSQSQSQASGGLRPSSSLGCLNGNGQTSDSEGEGALFGFLRSRNRFGRRYPEGPDNSGGSNSNQIANSAVSHSYEDITKPDYHNYLWLSSQWDKTDLATAAYFLPNWAQFLKLRKRKEESSEKHQCGKENGSRDAVLTQFLSASSSSSTCQAFCNYLQSLASLPDAFFPRRRITLPKKPKTLIIDLDETLVHSTAASCAKFDFMIEVLITRTSCLYYVFKRPNLDYFLDVVSNWYNLVIYTASLREYADPVIDLIDDGRKYFKKRLFRSSCTLTTSNFYLKDLALVDPDLSKICLLDNSAASFAMYPDNAVPIESWHNDPNDMALIELLPFLDALRFVEDVRSILSLRRLSLYFNQ